VQSPVNNSYFWFAGDPAAILLPRSAWTGTSASDRGGTALEQ